MPKYDVIRDHGDFRVGQVREGRKEDLAHLVGTCLVLQGSGAKAAPKANKNKAAPKDTANKSV